MRPPILGDTINWLLLEAFDSTITLSYFLRKDKSYPNVPLSNFPERPTGVCSSLASLVIQLWKQNAVRMKTKYVLTYELSELHGFLPKQVLYNPFLKRLNTCVSAVSR
jgi:hypothetical protein